MGTTINERIEAIGESLKCKSIRQFAKKIGVAPTSLNDVIKKGAEPKYSTLEKILKAAPYISAEWLLTGNGDIIKERNEDGSDSEEKRLQNIVASLKEKYNINSDEIAKKIGIDASYFTDIVAGFAPLVDSVAKKLMNAFPELNVRYLEDGTGDIFSEPAETKFSEQSKRIDDLLEIIKTQSSQLSESQEQINKLLAIIEKQSK